MLILSDVQRIVSCVTFRDWTFHVGQMGDGAYIQVRWTGPDTDTEQEMNLRGRKWYVSYHSIPDEIVKTCWMAVETALKHEAMEEFKLNGEAPFHPHNDVFEMPLLRKVHRTQLEPEPVDKLATHTV